MKSLQDEIVEIFQKLASLAEDMIDLGFKEEANSVILSAQAFAKKAYLEDKISHSWFNTLRDVTLGILKKVI